MPSPGIGLPQQQMYYVRITAAGAPIRAYTALARRPEGACQVVAERKGIDMTLNTCDAVPLGSVQGRIGTDPTYPLPEAV